jgi:hypothetical protein
VSWAIAANWAACSSAALRADDRMQAHVAGVDVPAGERVGEACRKVRRASDRAGAFMEGQVVGR